MSETKMIPLAVAEALFKLLDDIDNATDIFKPEMKAFEKYTYKQAGQRHKILISDGKNLTLNDDWENGVIEIMEDKIIDYEQPYIKS